MLVYVLVYGDGDSNCWSDEQIAKEMAWDAKHNDYPSAELRVYNLDLGTPYQVVNC